LTKHLTKAFQSNTTGSSSRFSTSVVVVVSVVVLVLVVLLSSSSFCFQEEEEEEDEETVKVFAALFPIPITFLHPLLLEIRNVSSKSSSSKRCKSRRLPLLGPRFRLFLEKELSSSMILLPVAKQLLRGKVIAIL
jgi:hypothetical protein